MLACFSSLAEIFSVIIPFSCVVLRCGDKWKKENSRLLLFTPSNFTLDPCHDMTQCRNTVLFGAG